MQKRRNSLKNSAVLAVLLTACALCLSACSGAKSKNADLEKFINDVKQRPVIKKATLPQDKLTQPTTYTAKTLRSPFDGKMSSQLNKEQRSPLENYAVSALKLVGTINHDNKIWAVIQTPDGMIYEAQIGDHIGQNHGKIIKIVKGQIDISEPKKGDVSQTNKIISLKKLDETPITSN